MNKKRLKLSNPQEVRRGLSRVANMLLNHEIDPKEANAIIYACNGVLASLRVDEQQKRIDELESIVNDLIKE